jgi:hypothetical protein
MINRTLFYLLHVAHVAGVYSPIHELDHDERTRWPLCPVSADSHNRPRLACVWAGAQTNRVSQFNNTFFRFHFSYLSSRTHAAT